MPDRRGQDKITVRFGKREMAYYTGGMSGSTSYRDPKKFEGDTLSKIYFDAQLREDGTIWLVNMRYDPMSFETCCSNNYLIVQLDSSTWHVNGQRINQLYQQAMDNSHFYSLRDGELYGFDRYLLYRKEDNQRTSPYIDYLININDKNEVERFLEMTTPRPVKGNAGGVMHYFMYNDLVQVNMHYRKVNLANWQTIENAMIAYIDQLYKDAEQ